MPPYFPKDKIKTIYNGYDDEVAAAVQSLSPGKDKFIISYAGTIYPMQKLEMFLEGFKLFIEKTGVKPAQAELHFWGLQEDATSVQRVEKYNGALMPYLHIHGKVGYKEVMKELSAAHLLLLLVSESNDWLNAKLFDYLALKRRILMVGNKNNLMAVIISENKAGASFETADDVAAYLQESYKMFISGNNRMIEPLHLQQYSRKSQALVFSQLLNNQNV
jgi:glycosyltransferase involved in cell wall biosynthesis